MKLPHLPRSLRLSHRKSEMHPHEKGLVPNNRLSVETTITKTHLTEGPQLTGNMGNIPKPVLNSMRMRTRGNDAT